MTNETTRRTRPAPFTERRPFDLWTRANAGEVLPGLISPITWSTIGQGLNQFYQDGVAEVGFKDGRGLRFATLYHGRMYFNVGALYEYWVNRAGAPSMMLLPTFGGPAGDQGLPLPERGLRWRRLIRYVPAIARQTRRRNRAPDNLRRAIPVVDDIAGRFAALDTEHMETAALFYAMADLLDELEPVIQVPNDCNSAAFAAYGMLAFLLKSWCGDAGLANDLVAGLDMTKTAECSADLWRIARKAAVRADVRALVARSSPESMLDTLSAHPLGSGAAADLRQFIARYGHRAVDELDIMNPRWAEDPSPLLAVFKLYVVSPQAGDPSMMAARQRQAREAATARVERLLRRRLIDRIIPWKRLLFRQYLKEAQTFVPLREDPKFHLLKVFLPVRRCYLALGRRFVDQGLLDAPEHVFFMVAEEVEDASLGREPGIVGLRERVRGRLADYERWSHLPIPWALGPDEQPLERDQAPLDGRRVLSGLAASSGRVTAVARVITHLRQADTMREGEVLVAPFTDPGWTPLFPLCAAVVTDLGGLMSHGAIVAREYGVPAVINTGDATVIQSGDRITVDGNEGKVYLDT